MVVHTPLSLAAHCACILASIDSQLAALFIIATRYMSVVGGTDRFPPNTKPFSVISISARHHHHHNNA
jgi:hypothetical protein